MESWRTADGTAGIIEVSNLGSVRRKMRIVQGGTKIVHGGSHCQWIGVGGYKMIQIMILGKRNKYLVHRLVAFAFVDGFKDGLTVNHINGIKTDNRAVNLEWVTKSENTKLQWATGLVNLRGENHPSHKLKDSHVAQIMQSNESIQILAKRYCVSLSLIYKIKSGHKRSSRIPS